MVQLTAGPWTRENPLLEAALHYASKGLEVLPVSPGSKAPLTQHGFHDATTDPEQIRQWWNAWPDANVGARPSGIGLVLDVDPRNGGDVGYANWCADHGDLDTAMAATGGGGRHVWFACDPVKNIKYGQGERYVGIDVISATGYVLMPPSRHPSGGRYDWLDTEDLMPPVLPLPSSFGQPVHYEAPWSRAKRQHALTAAPVAQYADVREALKRIDPDVVYADWVAVGQAIHSACWEEGFELWDAWSAGGAKYPGVDELRRKWASFDADGQVGLGTLFHMAGQLRNQIEKKSVLATPCDPDAMFQWADAFSQGLEPPNYVVDGLIRRGYLYGLTGHSNAGKTAIGIDMACAVACGERFGGRITTGEARARVLFLAGENDVDVRGRVRGWCEYNDVDIARLASSMAFMPVAGPIEEFIEPILAFVAEHGPFDLIMADSKLVYFGGDDENAQVENLAQAKAFRALTKASGHPAVVVLCHPTKSAEEETLYPRGAYSFTNELDTNLTAWNDAEVVRLHHNKIRGLTFEPLYFRMETHLLRGIADNHGQPVTTVVAAQAPNPERSQQDVLNESDQLLVHLSLYSGKRTVRELCGMLGWMNEKGEPKVSMYQRRIRSLEHDKLIRKPRADGPWRLTEKGEKFAAGIAISAPETTQNRPWEDAEK